jgi:hypothetical protein
MSFVQLASTDIVVSADTITAPAWSTGNSVLTGLTYTTGPGGTTTYLVASGSNSTTTEFSMTYGNINGYGSVLYNTLVPGLSPTRTVYGQYRNLVYGTETQNFNFGGLNTSSVDIHVINVNRNAYKQQLYAPTFNLTLTSGSATVKLTNDSTTTSTVTYLDCGRAFNIVSGSNGVGIANSVSTAAGQPAGWTVSGSYGLFLPDVGLIVLNSRALAMPAISGGILLSVGQSTNTDNNNSAALGNAIASGIYFQLNSEETVSSDYIFVRAGNAQFNYTTNPSAISGSTGTLTFPTMINNPQTFPTTVGLYNANNELIAVAKLSQPFVKDFTKEALFRVKLNF